MTQKITVTPLADITDLITGTTAPWYWEVQTCYVNTVSVTFSWSDGILTIPSYAGGRVLVEFTLYLLYDEVSQYLPKDPTNPASPVVYWENRLRAFFVVSSTIKSFEKGLTDVSGGSIGITLDDNWIQLARVPLVFSNSVIRVYTNDAISFKGITNQKSYADYVLTINVQKRQTILESECHWGDPAYLNRVDRTVSTAFYSGSAIPEKYQGMAIPMLFGPETPYRVAQNEEVEIGEFIGLSLVPPLSNKSPGRTVSFDELIVKIIPTSSTTGIIGRMPSYQTLTSVPINEALTGSAHTFERGASATNPVILNAMIQGQICTLSRPGHFTAARYYNKIPGNAFFVLGVEDSVEDMPVGGYGSFDTILDTNQRRHFFSASIPTQAWTDPAVLTGTPGLTPGGNIWITCSVTGLDLLANECYCVLTGITGARSGPEVLKFALEKHGYTVDAASFAALSAEMPATTIQKVGVGETIPTLGEFISEINEPLMTVLVFPASNDVPFLIKIEPRKAATSTLREKQIADLTIQDNYVDIAKNVRFLPKYAQSPAFINTLTVDIPTPLASQFLAERTKTILHPFSTGVARYYEVAEVYGCPNTLVSFTLLDDEAQLELGDMVQIEHSEFNQRIIIVSIATRPIGRVIQGRYLYVIDD